MDISKRVSIDSIVFWKTFVMQKEALGNGQLDTDVRSRYSPHCHCVAHHTATICTPPVRDAVTYAILGYY